MSEKGEGRGAGGGDWIRLLVKYKGKCAQCGKEIPQGEYALWSRSSKAIKHLKCEADNPVAGQKREKKDDTVNGGGAAAPPPSLVPELECFICGKAAGCAECGFEADCNRLLVSQACICSHCLSEPGAYDSYVQAFLVKARKAAKGRLDAQPAH